MEADASSVPRDLVQAAEDMPTISPVLGKINKISREMETSPRELIKIIMLDPILTGKVIRLVNSSFYGLTQKVQSLAQAVVYLGVNTVKNVAISTALLSTVVIKEKNSPLNPEAFWQHCLATAVGAKLLAKNLGMAPDKLEMFFVSGLLHDVGKILFIKAAPDRYCKALDESRRLGVSLAFAELAHFGCCHTQAGGVLARKWKLDTFLVDVIERHHSLPEKKKGSVNEVVAVANNLSKESQAGVSGNCVVEEMAGDIVQRLHISQSVTSRLTEQLPAELEKAAEFLNLIKELKIK